MQEMLDELVLLLKGVWLKRRYIIIISWLVCPVGWILVTMLPNQYTSEARVYADTRSILQPLLSGLAIRTDPTTELQLMAKTLLSRPNLEIIARDIDADVRATTSQEYEAIIKDLESNIRIRFGGRENLYSIDYQGKDPVYAKDVVQAALNVFVENTLSEQRLDTDQANVIISSQISDYEKRLVEAEVNLANFKREYVGFMPGSSNGYYSQLESNKASYDDAKLALSESESRLSSVQVQLNREESRAREQLSKVWTKHDDRIEQLQNRLDDLVFRFTDSHPDVVETRRQLDEVKELQRLAQNSTSIKDVLIDNAVYQDLKLTASQLRNEVASLRVRVNRYESKIAELQHKLDTVPDVEAKLTALTRNYQITREKYEQLLSRKESAQISQSVGDSSDDIKFRIIDAPRVPLKASGPNRPMLFSGVLVLGIGGGIGLAFLLSQVGPVITSTTQLHKLMDYQVLGVVSTTKVSGLIGKEKRKVWWFYLFNIVLIALFVLFLSVNSFSLAQERLIQGVNVLMQEINI
ncbi:XrtA system polysaccharide chain length determinant [Vibrio algarum]|uniref:GNVR domain-containing protein n=1 Tax=Vibrio algarum TaxID=3020714 RepID=A0ABT4YQ90_9VIBR|nr:XrtA system polysaccharide chain length determinant [Vibrio sp. KJ40-1]MDB1123729.1 GNVR domain-containing protein [Vibrio sp. KJ40-1]